ILRQLSLLILHILVIGQLIGLLRRAELLAVLALLLLPPLQSELRAAEELAVLGLIFLKRAVVRVAVLVGRVILTVSRQRFLRASAEDRSLRRGRSLEHVLTRREPSRVPGRRFHLRLGRRGEAAAPRRGSIGCL